MFEIVKDDEVKELIAITKSDSGVSGPILYVPSKASRTTAVPKKSNTPLTRRKLL